MRILSATDAISPAIARTKLVLFTPFRKGRTWKLGATAYLSFYGTIFLPFPLIYLFFLHAIKAHASAAVAVAALCGILAFTALCLWIFHLCSRLQFAFFDIVLNRGEFVAPAWRKYGPQSRRWTAVKAAAGTAVTLALGLPIAAYVRHLIPLMESIRPDQPPPPEFMAAIFAGEGLIFLGFGSLFLFSAVVSDFIVPSLALENTTIGEAFRRFFALVRNEAGQFSLYVLLKIGLALAGYMAQTIIFYIVVLIFVILLAIILGIGYLVLHALGVSVAIMIVLACLVGIPSYFILIFYVMFVLIGTVFTFLQAYTLYFLGGRYPLLGDLLDRSTPPSAPLPPHPGYTYAAPPPTSL